MWSEMYYSPTKYKLQGVITESSPNIADILLSASGYCF